MFSIVKSAWDIEIRACKGRPRQSIRARFESYQKKQISGCIEWTGHRFHFGHGCFATGRKYLDEVQAHRLAYMLEHDIVCIPPERCVTHRCDNPPCVNPAHLLLGTVLTNNADIDIRGRRQIGEDRPASKLTEVSVTLARSLSAGGETSIALAKRFGVSQATMHSAITGKTWKHVL